MATILIIEDTDSSMLLIKFIIEKEGHHVLQATNAEEGLKIVRDKKPDLILMDIQLPGMDGLTATRLLKSDITTKSIPVLAVTAFAMKEDEKKIFSAGCDDYLAKPIHHQIFLSKINHLLCAM